MKMTDCSNNCGGGRYLRSRNCEYASDDPDTYGEACEGEVLSYEECNIMSCPKSGEVLLEVVFPSGSLFIYFTMRLFPNMNCGTFGQGALRGGRGGRCCY